MKSNFGKRELFFLAFILTAIIPAAGESAETGTDKAVLTLSSDDAVKLALANNESLKQAAIALESKRRAAGISWNALIPSISVGAGIVQTNGDIFANGTAATTIAQVPVSLSLALNASVPQALEAAKLAYEGQLVSYGQAKQKLALAIRKSFYAIILDKAQLELSNQNVKRQQAGFTQTETKYKAGLVSELDYLKARVSLETLKPTELGYAMTLQNDIDSFKNYLGLKSGDAIDVTGRLDVDDSVITATINNAMNQDASANLDVAAALNALANAKVAAKKTFNSNYLPTLSLTGSVSPKTPLSPGGSATATTSLSAVVSVALDNYLPFSAAHERLAGANDTVKSSESALAEAVKTTQVSRLSGRRSVETYQSTVEVLRMNVDLTQKTYDATKLAYDKGLETMTDLLSAAGDLESAQFNSLSKSYSLIAALLTLQYETGMPLDTTGRF